MLFQPPAPKNICAIVVSHTPGKSFISNIKSIKIQVDKVVVVNNGSEKLNPDFLEKAGVKEKVHLINNSENLGQGKALNQGADWAVSQGYQWLLLLDQDSLLCQSMVQELIGAYQNCRDRERVRMVGSNCTYRNLDQVKYIKECQGRLFFERDVVMMSGTLLSLLAYKKVGPFREEFFVDSIDADYCLRIRAKGFKIIVSCNAQMVHSVGINGVFRNFLGKKFLVTNHNHIRCYYMIRNGLILVKEFFFKEPYWAFKRIVWYFLVKPGLVVLYEKDKTRKLKGMFIGVVHALIRKTGKYQT